VRRSWAILRDRRFQLALFVVFLLQSLVLAFLIPDFLLLYSRTDNLCTRCAQITVQRSFGMVGKLFFSNAKIQIPTDLSRSLDSSSCSHHIRFLGETDLFLAAPSHGGLSFQFEPRRFDTTLLKDPLLVEALGELAAADQFRAQDALQWVIEAVFAKQLGVTTNLDAVLRARDRPALVRLLQTAPASEVTMLNALAVRIRSATNSAGDMVPLPRLRRSLTPPD
jgi:hypothetical protein